MDNDAEDKRLASLLNAFTLASERTKHAVLTDKDLDRAYRRVDQASEHVRKLYEDLTALRSQVAARIYETEKLSLSVLAERWGVSKTRAGQIIRAAQPKTGDSE
ncbi:hypothetical protein GCM10022224_036500 [Nonomuraea antimicrobica]|uniref:Sigma-70, region 4 n=1 Tax=Nonomuraea antimicrobica TaxID=561173 RepID=A0ABP7BV09_9ACTN